MSEQNNDGQKYVKTITVTSGKGGVGKTNIVVNLAISLRKQGKKVLIMDADMGLSNIDVLLQLAPRHTIQHVLAGQRSLMDVVVDGPHGIKILPASSGIQELTALNEFQRLKILEEFDSYAEDLDVLLIDTAAGISENVSFFCIAAQDIVVITTPEPTAVTDAYALIKVLFTRYQEKRFRILVNSVRNSGEGFEVFRRLSVAAERFLNISLDYLDYIPVDESIPQAVRAQQPFLDLFPNCAASKQMRAIATKLDTPRGQIKGTLQFFIGNLVSQHSSGPPS